MNYICVLCLLLGSLLEAGQLRHIYVTWEEDPCQTMTIHAHGIDTPPTLTLYYDTTPHRSACADYSSFCEVRAIKGPVKGRWLYHAPLQHLQPETTYYFTLAEQRHPLCSEQRCKTLASHPPYRIVEAGDWENTSTASTLAHIAFSYQPDAVWLGGDYPSGVAAEADYAKWDAWLDTFTEAMHHETHHLVPFVMAIGNHEVIGHNASRRAPFYFPYFRPDGNSYFSLPIGEDVHLFVLDSGHMASHGGKQKQWLAEQLNNEHLTPIKIALYHVPLYPSVRFTEKTILYNVCVYLLNFCHVQKAAQRLFSLPSLLGQEHWQGIFDTYGLTVAFEHHDQALKRTKRLRNGQVDPQGTLYLGDGGFSPERQMPPLKGYFDSRITKTKGQLPFFWLIDIAPDHLHYRAISLDHRLIDTYTQDLTSSSP